MCARRCCDALLDAARDVLDEAAEHAGCVPRSGCAWAVLRAAVAAEARAARDAAWDRISVALLDAIETEIARLGVARD